MSASRLRRKTGRSVTSARAAPVGRAPMAAARAWRTARASSAGRVGSGTCTESVWVGWITTMPCAAQYRPVSPKAESDPPKPWLNRITGQGPGAAGMWMRVGIVRPRAGSTRSMRSRVRIAGSSPGETARAGAAWSKRRRLNMCRS